MCGGAGAGAADRLRMSYYKTAWIYCDGEDCPIDGAAATELEHANASEARAQLKKQGWINRGALDFCPECADHDGQGLGP